MIKNIFVATGMFSLLSALFLKDYLSKENHQSMFYKNCSVIKLILVVISVLSNLFSIILQRFFNWNL